MNLTIKELLETLERIKELQSREELTYYEEQELKRLLSIELKTVEYED